MKKILTALFAGLAVFSLNAAETANTPAAAPAQAEKPALPPCDRWTAFQIGILPGIPQAMYNSNVFGIKSGWPVCCGIGRVKGLEASWIYSGTRHIQGIQASWVSCHADELDGLQANFVMSLTHGNCNGLQASCGYVQSGDMKGLQAGAVTLAKDVAGFQAGVALAKARNFSGFQTSVVALSEELSGIQFSLYGQKTKGTAVQFGLVNISSGKGVQFGLINIMSNGILPFFPVLNINF